MDTRMDEAARWANLAGGYEPLLAAAETALARNDYQWVLEITDRLLRLDPSDPRPRNARVTALTALGWDSIIATDLFEYPNPVTDYDAIFVLVGIYNKLVALKNRFKNAFAQIEVQLACAKKVAWWELAGKPQLHQVAGNFVRFGFQLFVQNDSEFHS